MSALTLGELRNIKNNLPEFSVCGPGLENGPAE